jgi:Protein of unknown function (DUF2804)
VSTGIETLPWRGPGPGRPDDLPLPPKRMPLRFKGVNRKRWRYLGAFSEEVMVCAARVGVGPASQTFWAVWDREDGELTERTVMRLPGARGEVWSEDGSGNPVENAPDDGSLVRIEAAHPEGGGVRGFLRTGAGAWAECVCPNGEQGFVWTRKRVVEVDVDVRVGERRIRCTARGIEDESAGYHPRHTVWSWSAGVGTLTDGREVGWNFVEGVNDPPERSERAIWVDGEPFEPGPSAFRDLEAVSFEDGSGLEFRAEAERSRTEKRGPIAYSYRQPFGTFAGTLPGGLALEAGMGVMESHDATW